ncbi:DUF4097 family beta strand repeat-containing protein [Granulicatella balaenopterae]|nr:DUF4097 family beta strand repeat-containing protein [Granulicatella balaenopterae]
MKEKDRILELVKKGVISSSEAIELLEQIGQKKADNETIEEYIEEIPEKNADYYEKVDKKRLNTILGDIASAVGSITGDANKEDQRIINLEKSIAEKKERLTELETLASIGQLTVDDEMELQRITEILDSLIEQLESLEIEKQRATEEKIRKTKAELNHKYKQVKEKVQETNWEEKVNQSANLFTSAMGNITNKVAKVVKDAGESVEWQEKTVSIPKIATTEFEQTITSEPTTATIIDIKVANGDIILETWDKDYVKIDANYKLYGVRANNKTPLELLAERSTIEITDEKIMYHIPNKRVNCEVTLHVPNINYDYTKIETLNANLTLQQVKGKDYYIKVKNGDVNLYGVSGTMAELDMMNGDIEIAAGKYRDICIKNINGDLEIETEAVSYDVTTVNGDIDLEVASKDSKKVMANTTNGDIHMELTEGLSMEAMMKTSFGEVIYNQEAFETELLQKEVVAKIVKIKKINEALPINMTLVTIAGDIVIN